MAHTAAAQSFGQCHAAASLVDGDIGRCVVELKVGPEHANIYGTAHGGFSATLIDAVSTYALVTDDMESLKKLGVSVNLSMEYLKAAKVGEDILIDAKLIKRGRNLAFLTAEIRKKETDELLVRGSHTKFIG